MTKHNGKARKSGIQVGAALLASRKKNGIGGNGSGSFNSAHHARHTTDLKVDTNMQSVLERNDLSELMAMADLAGRDFTAERTNAIVISTGTVNPLDEQRAAEERAATEERNRHRLKLPRRPAWDETTTPEQLDHQERTEFVEWRRVLAQLEEEERLVLTPFEKNLEVWRQLWRVLERSDIVVQVVDARDPMLYRCDDLEAYAKELHHTKTSLLLLNKADLLPLAVRKRWADYLDKIGMPYAFWSAHLTMEEQAALKSEAHELGVDWHELHEERSREHRLARIAAEAQLLADQGEAALADVRRTHIMDVDELTALLEDCARQAVEEAGPDDPRAKDDDRRLMVGLVGYPNVGKSSTINALFGAKKAAVAPTPGKTKHFQTLIVSPTLCLCDCPGLVMPKFARSKAEMVAAGVIPIDRLTDMRAPVEVLANRVGRKQFETLYGLRLTPAPAHLPPNSPPSAADVLRALAVLRGWTVGSGLPDESRAGRLLLRDYTSGKLLHCTLPPGSNPDCFVPFLHDPETLQQVGMPSPSAASTALVRSSVGGPSSAGQTSGAGLQSVAEVAAEDDDEGSMPLQPEVGLGALDEADLDLLAGQLGEVGLAGTTKVKPKRAEHKYQKKMVRTKGDRGQARDDGGGYDGAAMKTGKKGGLVRVTGY